MAKSKRWIIYRGERARTPHFRARRHYEPTADLWRPEQHGPHLLGADGREVPVPHEQCRRLVSLACDKAKEHGHHVLVWGGDKMLIWADISGQQRGVGNRLCQSPSLCPTAKNDRCSAGPADAALAVLKRNLTRHPDDRGSLLAVVSFSREKGDFVTALESAKQLARAAPDDGFAAIFPQWPRH